MKNKVLSSVVGTIENAKDGSCFCSTKDNVNGKIKISDEHLSGALEGDLVQIILSGNNGNTIGRVFKILEKKKIRELLEQCIKVRGYNTCIKVEEMLGRFSNVGLVIKTKNSGFFTYVD